MFSGRKRAKVEHNRSSKDSNDPRLGKTRKKEIRIGLRKGGGKKDDLWSEKNGMRGEKVRKEGNGK